MLNDTVMTVTGPLGVEKLGRTLMHEHLILDGSSFFEPSDDPAIAALADAAMTPEIAGRILGASCSNHDNLQLDDRDLTLTEIRAFVDLGGSSIIDVTSGVGLGRDPAGLRELSLATGIPIVMGSGFYCEYSHPDWIAAATVDDLSRIIVDEFVNGVDGVRPGIIGEIGINGQRRSTLELIGEMTPDEEKTLRAAARASRKTGAALCVHQPNRSTAVPAIIGVLEEEAVDPSRVILAHMSSIPDFGMHEYALERGFWIAYDNFGMARLSNARYRPISDEQRADWTVEVVHKGYGDRLLISQDIWCKLQLRHYGGGGYSHILRTIVPLLLSKGLAESDIDQLLIHNPAAVLPFR